MFTMNKDWVLDTLQKFAERVKNGVYGEIEKMKEIDKLADELTLFAEEVDKRSYDIEECRFNLDT